MAAEVFGQQWGGGQRCNLKLNKTWRPAHCRVNKNEEKTFEAFVYFPVFHSEINTIFECNYPLTKRNVQRIVLKWNNLFVRN